MNVVLLDWEVVSFAGTYNFSGKVDFFSNSSDNKWRIYEKSTLCWNF